MSKIKSRNTKIETLVFGELRRRGIYFQKHYKTLGEPDIALPRKKVAVFIDGDFWHGYKFTKWQSRLPRKYWHSKIGRNIKRDRKNTRKLKVLGWTVLRVWEHEIISNLQNASDKIAEFLTAAQRLH